MDRPSDNPRGPENRGPENLDQAVEWLRKAFRPDAASDVQVRYRIELGGPEGGALALDVDRGRLEVSVGKGRRPDVIFRLGARAFYGVLVGSENPDLLFMADELVIDGDLSLALKLRKLFNAPI